MIATPSHTPISGFSRAVLYNIPPIEPSFPDLPVCYTVSIAGQRAYEYQPVDVLRINA